MSKNCKACNEIDEVADQARGYFVSPSEEDVRYMELLFDVSRQLGI